MASRQAAGLESATVSRVGYLEGLGDRAESAGRVAAVPDGASAASVASAARAAVSAAAPKRRIRPPKAIAQIANQAQPSARPAITSDSQCTSSSTRARGDRDGDPRCEAREHRPRRATAPSSDQERRSGVEGGSGRRVAARERRPQRRSGRVERRAHAVGELLDRDVSRTPHRAMTATMNGATQYAPLPDRLGDGEDDTEHDDRVDASELRDGVEHVRRRRRWRGCFPISPRRCRSRSAASLRGRGTRARRPARRRRSPMIIASVSASPVAAAGSSSGAQEGAEIRVPPDRLADLARLIQCREPCRRRGPRVSPALRIRLESRP